MNRLWITALAALAMGGCTAAPRVSPDGRISGGWPRYRALLEFADEQRRLSGAGTALGPVAVMYTGVIGPGRMSGLDLGELPMTAEGAPGAVYAISSANDAVGDARYAVLTEFRVDARSQVRCTARVLEWDDNQHRWVTLRSVQKVEDMTPEAGAVGVQPGTRR